jgi:hypothetical protein
MGSNGLEEGVYFHSKRTVLADAFEKHGDAESRAINQMANKKRK